MTSRKKILAIARAADTLQCAVLLKTGFQSPGIMLAEGKHADEWLKFVKVPQTPFSTTQYDWADD
jgi:hypothetical protein